MRPTFDERDEKIKQERLALWNAVKGPRVGDFVKMPDGSLRRFTHDWSDSLQTTVTFQSDESFYFAGPYMSFSGSLDPGISKENLTDTGEIKEGRCWFFHHGYVQAHGSVHTTVPCRVYEYTGEMP